MKYKPSPENPNIAWARGAVKIFTTRELRGDLTMRRAYKRWYIQAIEEELHRRYRVARP
jgi:hypothetical protein